MSEEFCKIIDLLEKSFKENGDQLTLVCNDTSGQDKKGIVVVDENSPSSVIWR